MTTYTLIEALAKINTTIEVDLRAQSQTLHRWIGERYLVESGRKPGSGTSFEYTEKDIRRAISYLRLRRLVGSAVGSGARVVADRIREVASWNTDGYVVATIGVVEWVPTIYDVGELIENGSGAVAIPCWVRSFLEG